MPLAKRNRDSVDIRKEAPPFLGDRRGWWHWEVRTANGSEAAGWSRGNRARAQRAADCALERLHRIERFEVPGFVVSREASERYSELVA